jgi:hypothetical protein
MPKRLSALILDTDHVTDRNDSERRWIVVGFGWGGPEVAHVVGPPGHASIPILSAFGGDAMSPVLRAVRRRVGIIAVRSPQYCSGGSASAAGTPPVDRHKLGNSSALPGVVT